MNETIDEEIRVLRSRYWSERDPDGRAFAPLADAYRRMGELEEAETLIRDGLGRLPQFATGHLVAARVARDRKDLVDARQHLERVLELDPENVVALLEHAEVGIADGDRERALADLQKVLELEPGEPRAQVRLEELEEIAVWRSGGGDADAVTDLEVTGVDVDDDPGEAESAEASEGSDHSHYTRTMGEIYARQGFVDQAVEIFQHLAARHPDDADIASRLTALEKRVDFSVPDEFEGIGGGLDMVVEKCPEDGLGDDLGDETVSPRRQTIEAYFEDLLAWVPGAVPIESLAPDAVPIESLAPDSVVEVATATAPAAMESSPRNAVPIESLAPDEAPSAPSPAAGAPDTSTIESPPDHSDDNDPSDDMDEFQSWLESLQP